MILPFTSDERDVHGEGFYQGDKRFVTHTELINEESAFYRTQSKQILIMAGIAIFFVIGFLLNWHAFLVILIGVLTIIYFADLLFNLFLIYRSFSRAPEIVVGEAELAQKREQWPMYTIFCPLYKEAEVLPQFVEAMAKLDYPTDRLQILLLLEENDPETVEAAKAMNLPKQFEIVVVPHSMPKTKPKACNYGLKKAVGEYVVIFDAEDVPEPDQLKKAIIAFERLGERVVCVQAKLNFYNPRQNILTRVFTAEYSLWFDLVLTGLQSIKAPIPLGGTSNHFRTHLLKEIKGWDAFNVTEDCDLGMRLVKRGYLTAIVDSTTWEEANSEAMNWFWQRTRWIKGYIQTYLVHMRRPQDFLSKWSEPHVVTFQLVVGGKIMSMFINPTMWLVTISYFVLRSTVGPFIQSLYPAPVLYMAVFCLIFGNFLYMYYYMIGCAKRGQDDLLKYVLLVPIYWLGMSLAAWVSVYKFIVAPHHWSKTKHGLHLAKSKPAVT